MMRPVHEPSPSRPIADLPVGLRPITAGDLELLRALLGDPAMTRHLGGPESDTQIRSRFHRLLRDRPAGATFAITVGDDRTGVGWVGWWEITHDGGTVWEAGLSLLIPWQGQGIARRAFRLALDRAAAARRHRLVHSFVALDNDQANRMCERVGFTRIGELDVADPRGRPIRCVDWRYDLWPAATAPEASR
jgi:RimJ/RimL family protein N-acetyltransferase